MVHKKDECGCDKKKVIVSVLLVGGLMVATALATHRMDMNNDQAMENQTNQLTWLLRKKNLQIKTLQSQLVGVKDSLEAANKGLMAAKNNLDMAAKEMAAEEIPAMPAAK